MKRLLILSIFPAPYRVSVFRGLAERYQIDLYFEFVQNQNRNAKWFVESDEFTVLTTPEAVQKYEQALKNLTQYDLVLAYDYFSKRAMKLMMQCIRRKVPYCINCDGAFINRNFIKDRVKHFFVSRAAACFASGVSASDYFRHYGADRKRIHIHNFTSLTREDIRQAPVTADEVRDVRRELGIKDCRTVLTIGQFIHRKGNDILLQSWEGMPEDYQLLIIGGGDLAPEYEKFIREHHLKNVHILGFMDKERVMKYYMASDLFVLPTREDIWGLVINEAMANGLPVVTTDRCIAGRELVANGENGYLVPAEDPDELRKRMREILGDDGLRQRMQKANIGKMQDNTMENIVKSHIPVIDSLLGIGGSI
ncbi:glycosyltransferase family 4 protein [Lachnotalea sp. AF33-28]|uniref:glycosyltransferase family 4 protein n=1 Tax=Lachnotalea sp. AF33-28 TaxID=2292046 RepID=UPI000E488DFB|nr:glycosyltransferase family 4 protein [Lachnotalea sp. AF33-28]RHP34992.1 glycosyltransferase family 1 protein [Lachnotalea sp. AF33-28]